MYPPDILLERLTLGSRQRHFGDTLRDFLDLRGILADSDRELPGERLPTIGQQRDALDIIPVQHEPEARAHVVEPQLVRLRPGDRDEQVIIESSCYSGLFVRETRRDDILRYGRVLVVRIQAVDDRVRTVPRQRPLEEGRGRLLCILGHEGRHLPFPEHRDAFLRHPEDGGIVLVERRPRPAVPFHIGSKNDLFGGRREHLLLLGGASSQ